jgi:hypothetical protein
MVNRFQSDIEAFAQSQAKLFGYFMDWSSALGQYHKALK